MDTYKATNTLNGKFYIGSSENFERRKNEHLQSKENYPFQNALRKNPEAFEWGVVKDESDEPLLEQALLDMWFGTEQCYNLNPFASRPPITRLFGEDNPMYGRTGEDHPMYGVTKEDRPFYGKKHTEETLKKMSELKLAENNPFFGRNHSEEFKERQSERMSGEGNPMYGLKRPGFSEMMSGEENPMYGKTGKDHHCFGKKRWVNAKGERKWQAESPGPEWQNGIKWKEG